MQSFYYDNDTLFLEHVNLAEIAQKFSTPCYVYSHSALRNNWLAFDEAFGTTPHTVCFAVKANPNLAILHLLATLGSGFDIVSMGELERVLAVGASPRKIIFSGVGKQTHEIVRALESDIYCFNVESFSELGKINSLAAQQQKIARIALRINPDVDPNTHPYIATGLNENKFGIPCDEARDIIQKIKTFSNVKLIGIACHIGSQLTSLQPFLHAMTRLANVIECVKKAGITLEHINMGGGLGVSYRNETPPSINAYVKAIVAALLPYACKIIVEPGRAIVANTCALITKIIYLKQTPYKNFAIVDAAMNDFIRPALYDAWHDILPIQLTSQPKKIFDIAGPICESADFLGKNRELAVDENDLLAIMNAGAYGFSMSSHYNSRPRAAEILINGKEYSLIRHRENIKDLFREEVNPTAVPAKEGERS